MKGYPAEHLFSSQKEVRLDGRCNECNSSKLIQSERDMAVFYLKHQGHTVSIIPLKKKSRQSSESGGINE